MKQKCVLVRAFRLFLVSAFVLATPLAALAVNPVFGTVQVNGPVFLNDGSGGWNKVELTRPMVAGDHMKTGEDGYLLADLGAQGIVGMYGNSEITAGESGGGPLIDVRMGKLAFHMGASSSMTITAADAEILPAQNGAVNAADGYVEINTNGDAVVAVEKGELAVRIAGVDRTLKTGERLLLNQKALGGEFDETDRLAALDQLASADEAAGMAGDRADDESDGETAAWWASGAGGLPNPLIVAGGVAVVVGGVVAASNHNGASDSNGSAN